jgi:Holliday junction resolvase RusA-like endonuclease
MDYIDLKILGEPTSKANSRKVVLIKGKIRVIKSQKALDYCKHFALQCPQLDDPFDCDLFVEIHIYYASRRPDLDESLILDNMQNKIYKNDRQIKIKHIYWHLDKENPRAEIKVRPIQESDYPSSNKFFVIP